MTNRTNPEQTPDMAGPTNEEVEAVARELLSYWGEKEDVWEMFRKAARAAIRALDEVRGLKSHENN
jgi:hypothetical protein